MADKNFNIVYFSVTSNEIPNLSSAVKQFQTKIAPLNIHARTRTQLDSSKDACKQFIDKALNADILVVTLMSGSRSCPAWNKLILGLDQQKDQGRKLPYFHVQPTGSNEESMEMVQKYSRGLNTDLWKTLNQYFRYGGKENLFQMLICFYNKVFKENLPLKTPKIQPQDGIYHPDLKKIPEPCEYFKTLDNKKPTIGIWFYQNFYITGNNAHINGLIREIEKQNANVICVFHTRFKDKNIPGRGLDKVIDRYFMDNEKPRINVLINPVMFSLNMVAPEYKDLLSRLNVPVIQAMSTSRSIKEWEQSDQGLNIIDITISVAQPELDGVIIGVPVAAKQLSEIDPITGSAVNKYVPIGERIEKIISLAMNWAKLCLIPNKDKKIAIVFHHYPPRNDRIGCASGLDTFESIRLLLLHMQKQGYKIEKSWDKSNDLAKDLLDKMTCDRRWILPEQMDKKAEAKAEPFQYMPWHKSLPRQIQDKMNKDWGEMPGDLFVHNNKMLFSGLINGNVFLTIQPPRGYFEQIDKIYHDPLLSPPHHYLAHYKWIKNIFKAHAVLHVGKHGSLEWLPGKAVGLSNLCYPDLALMDIPNIYTYIINDPGEGTQAKRRSSACIIDHLPPALANADLYEELSELDLLINDYHEAEILNPLKKIKMIPLIWEQVVKANIDKDLKFTKESALADFNDFLETLHHYLSEISDTTITKGLHILGLAPENDDLVETLVQLTRLSNGNIPSLYESIVNVLGYDMDFVLKNRGKIINNIKGHTGAQILKKAYDISLAMVKKAISNHNNNISHPMEKTMEKYLDVCDEKVFKVLDYIVQDLYPRLLKTSDEIHYILSAFKGQFVPPGPSGAPSRGRADILPTGKNFYSVDPQKIPTKTAWETGKALANALIEKYMAEHNSYPDYVGIILWASPTMRTKGDDVAEILYLLGVEPVWQKGSGNVRGIKIIPLSELKRPRIDVMPKISGIFRDAFPLIVDLIDKAVQQVAMLKEPIESNFILNHVTKDVTQMTQKGMDKNSAFRQATLRLFGAAPGSYGTGVTKLIESKNWETKDDLGNIFIQWSCYAYGQDIFGRQNEKSFRKILKRISVTVKNEDTREKDMMTCTDFYGYHGGLISAVKSVQGKMPYSIAGDSANPDNIIMRTTKQEANHILRSRLLNPKWIQGLKAHGFKGAGDISKAMDIIFGWDATAKVIDDHMYQSFAEKTVFDKDIKNWMEQINPYALQNILDKLLEANARGMWNTDPDTIEQLKQTYLDIEGNIEEINT